eukprot:gene7894-10677_t
MMRNFRPWLDGRKPSNYVAGDFRSGRTVTNGPDGTGETGRGKKHETGIREDELERRRRELEASLATRLPNRLEGKDDAKAGSAAGYGQA